MHTLKQSNQHKARPAECTGCGRRMPKRAYKRLCATCIKTVSNWGKELAK